MEEEEEICSELRLFHVFVLIFSDPQLYRQRTKSLQGVHRGAAVGIHSVVNTQKTKTMNIEEVTILRLTLGILSIV